MDANTEERTAFPVESAVPDKVCPVLRAIDTVEPDGQ